MKGLCIAAVFMLSAAVVAAQDTNNLALLIEKSVIEYYDTLSNSPVFRNYRLQMYRMGELCDTNIYLSVNKPYCFIDLPHFLSKLQTPDKMPPKAYFSGGGRKYQFVERAEAYTNFPWKYCRHPKLKRNRSIEEISISNIDLQGDTIVISLALCYLSMEREWIKGRWRKIYGIAISDGVKFYYVFSDSAQEWVCVRRRFWGI